MPSEVQAENLRTPRPRARDALRRNSETLGGDGHPCPGEQERCARCREQAANRTALVWSQAIVRRVLAAQGKTEVPFIEWAALHRQMFPVGWPTLRALQGAWLARQLRADPELSARLRVSSMRAYLMARLGWLPARMSRTRLEEVAGEYHCGTGPKWFHNRRVRLQAHDKKLSDLEQRIEAEGVAIDWTPQGPQFHAIETKADMRDTA